MLNTIIHGEKTDKPTLVIVHGLYGSARNWGVIAKRLSDERQVIAVDQRNHGQSPWYDTHSYPEMAQDLVELLDTLDSPCDILGHSMGGKTAMTLALTRPDYINRLIVADIAPVVYAHSQIQYVKAMQAVDLAQVQTRSDAAKQLTKRVDNQDLVLFFLQSLDIKNKKWVLNLGVLEREMPNILGFPDFSTHFDGPTLFLLGQRSDYVLPEHRTTIKSLFPSARYLKLNNAGHWLHAEQPRAFEHTVRNWLNV